MAGHPPPGDGPPPPPRHAAPTGHAGQGDSVRPPHPYTRAHSTSVADPNSPPNRRAVGGGTAPDLRRSSQWWKAPPPGTPFRHPHSEQRQPARAHAVGPVLGSHARTDRTRDTRVTEPWLPASEDGRPGEGQRLTPGAPLSGGRPPPPGTAPRHPRGMQLPQGMQAKGTARDPTPTHPRPQHVGGRPQQPAPVGRQLGEGQRLASDAPHNDGRHPPRGRPSATPTAGNAGPQGRMLWGRCLVPTLAPTAPGTPGRGTLAAHPRGRAAGGGTAPDIRRPSQRWQATPGGTPFRHPHSEQRRPARAHAVGLVLGPHARTDRIRDTRVAEPWPPAPKDGRPGEGQRLTPGAPRNSGRPPPPGTAPHHPRGTQPPQGMQARGTVLGPHTHTPEPTATWVADPNSPPNRRAVGGGTAPDLRRPSHNVRRRPPRGRPSASPTASNAGPQWRTLWGRCWVPTPALTAPGTHGSRNPGYPLQMKGGQGRDSA